MDHPNTPSPRPYWVEFEGRSAACVNAPTSVEAKALAERITGHAVTRIDCLPYPASPALNSGPGSMSCYSPATCRGWGYCRRSIACNE